MADEEHLKILRQGVDVWNEWRRKNPELLPKVEVAPNLRARLIHQFFAGVRFFTVRLGAS
jgi:predicted secreted protein